MEDVVHLDAGAGQLVVKRLGYTRYVAQGGDWGAVITSAMARQAPPGLLAVDLNLAAVIPPEVAAALASGAPAPAGLSEQERTVFEASRTYAMKGSAAYFVMLTARPQAVGYGLTDSSRLRPRAARVVVRRLETVDADLNGAAPKKLPLLTEGRLP